MFRKRDAVKSEVTSCIKSSLRPRSILVECQGTWMPNIEVVETSNRRLTVTWPNMVVCVLCAVMSISGTDYRGLLATDLAKRVEDSPGKNLRASLRRRHAKEAVTIILGHHLVLKDGRDHNTGRDGRGRGGDEGEQRKLHFEEG